MIRFRGVLGVGAIVGLLCSAINTAKVQPGSRVVVIGVGEVGLNVVQGAALAGAGMIIAVDIRGTKLEQSLEFGAIIIPVQYEGKVTPTSRRFWQLLLVTQLEAQRALAKGVQFAKSNPHGEHNVR